jgi:hypothetical protein
LIVESASTSIDWWSSPLFELPEFSSTDLTLISTSTDGGKWLREPLSWDPLSVSDRIRERKRTGALRLE